FISGNEAFALGIRLARPDVVSAYPITPQTVVVERLSEMVADGELDSNFIHVESEHSAMSCAIGASAAGVRVFTATSSQGLLYMAECLPYAAGGRFPIVMMNADRSVALPWNIYGDHSDSLSQISSGWIQFYAMNAQEALDMAIMSYRIAEDPSVSTPFMVNLDGFNLTHTYENVDVPEQEEVDTFLPRYSTRNRIDLEKPVNMCFSAGPAYNTLFKMSEHKGILNAREVVPQAEGEFMRVFGRKYSGMIEGHLLEDAEFVIVTLGCVSGLCMDVADRLREDGVKAGVLRIRYMRPFPDKEIQSALLNSKAVCVLEKDVSFGNAGVVFGEVKAALYGSGCGCTVCNRIGGLGGRDISFDDIRDIFGELEDRPTDVGFVWGSGS
ncbi:MAG: hypothetical protein IJ856_04250, partial [Candidatus Methanomethylophilaceae archaeon]|nr:hypothetical protein [Candidatus Methanomethylophilaceae archaeon]